MWFLSSGIGRISQRFHCTYGLNNHLNFLLEYIDSITMGDRVQYCLIMVLISRTLQYILWPKVSITPYSCGVLHVWCVLLLCYRCVSSLRSCLQVVVGVATVVREVELLKKDRYNKDKKHHESLLSEVTH